MLIVIIAMTAAGLLSGLATAWARGGRLSGILGAITVLAPMAVVTGIYIRPLGNQHWFMAPGWVFNPMLNWSVMVLWGGLVPIRNIMIIANEEARRWRLVGESRRGREAFRAWVGESWLEIQNRLGEFPDVLIHPRLKQPCIAGFFRPLVLFPARWLPDEALEPHDLGYMRPVGVARPGSPWSQEQALAALAHELGHVHYRHGMVGWLRLLGSVFVPWEWSEGWLEVRRNPPAGIKRAYCQIGASLARVYEQSMRACEAQADEHAELAIAGGRAKIEGVRLALGATDTQFRIVDIQWKGFLLAACLGIGIPGWIIWVSPGQAWVEMSLGGRGAVADLRPKNWTWSQSKGQALVSSEPGGVGYLPPTRWRQAALLVNNSVAPPAKGQAPARKFAGHLANDFDPMTPEQRSLGVSVLRARLEWEILEVGKPKLPNNEPPRVQFAGQRDEDLNTGQNPMTLSTLRTPWAVLPDGRYRMVRTLNCSAEDKIQLLGLAMSFSRGAETIVYPPKIEIAFSDGTIKSFH